ncbi:MAG: bifunctional DNA-formamidopyrimidine glycosylase/DNA-(apurinic or apyrimidinic site) lyase [Verrucomicrobiota bacterium]
MPELPEVETTRRGIEPHVTGATVREVIVRCSDLRQPVSPSLSGIAGLKFTGVRRRAKYLLLALTDGSNLLIHLGMSGNLRVVAPSEAWKKHDHVGITLDKRCQLRMHDPRRFGLLLHLTAQDPYSHPLLKDLGPEPLEDDFTASHLQRACAKRSAAIKLVIMDSHVVVGVGNIYASEALFQAGIRPLSAARRLSLPRLARLVTAIRAVLTDSIAAGGTTLRDFLNSDGKPGYFSQSLQVYGRTGEPCHLCGSAICRAVVGQRATYWCPKCQR